MEKPGHPYILWEYKFVWTLEKDMAELLQKPSPVLKGRHLAPKHLEGNDLLCRWAGGNQFQIASPNRVKQKLIFRKQKLQHLMAGYLTIGYMN